MILGTIDPLHSSLSVKGQHCVYAKLGALHFPQALGMGPSVSDDLQTHQPVGDVKIKWYVTTTGWQIFFGARKTSRKTSGVQAI
jgi:hypothetical protein